MKVADPDDLLPLDEFASRRREFFEAHDAISIVIAASASVPA